MCLHQSKNILTILFIVQYINQIIQCMECEQKYYYPNETFIYNSDKYIVIDSDSRDVLSIDNYQPKLIEKKFQIILNSTRKIIATTQFDSYDKKKKDEQIICTLSLEDESFYYIQCTDGFKNNQNKNLFINEQNSFAFKAEQNINCEDFFYHNNLSFIIYCHDDINLLIYLINSQNLITLLISHQLSKQQIQNCKKQYYKLSNEKYLATYYQCIGWTAFKIENNQIQQFYFHQTLKLDDSKNQYHKVDNIILCQSKIYFIFNSQYFTYSIPSSMVNFGHFTYEIKNIVLNKECEIRYILSKQNLIFDLKFQDQQVFSIANEYLNMYLIQEFLLIQFQKTLFLRINPIFNQTFSILTQKIEFAEKFNLFYQLDNETQTIQVYQYKYLKDYIQPKKKYLSIFKILTQQGMVTCTQCFQINYLDQNSISQNLIVLHTTDKTQQDCHQIQDIQIEKDLLIIDGSYAINYSQNSPILNIQDRKNFAYFCYSQNSLHQELLYFKFNHKTKQQIFILLEHHVLLYAICNNPIKSQVFQIEQLEVIQYKDFIIIFKLYDKKLTLINNNNQDVISQVIQLYAHIVKYFQFNNYILIYTDQQPKPLVIQIQILNLHVFNYINEDIFLEMPIKFYYGYLDFQLVQYPNFITIKHMNNTFNFNFEDLIILQVEVIIQNIYEITALHEINNQIQTYYFNQDDLQITSIYTLLGYQFQTPLNYQSELKYLVIASIKNNQTFIHIFSKLHQAHLKLLDIIEIGISRFFISDYYLYYYDRLKQFMMYDLKYFIIKFNPITTIPQAPYYSFNISLISQSNSSKNLKTNLTIELKVQQFCYQILIRAQQITISLHTLQNEYLSLNQYFYGPINNLTLENTSQFQLRGPFIKKDIIKFCKNYQSNKCIYQTYLSSNQSILNLFFFKQDNDLYLLDYNKTSNGYQYVLQLFNNELFVLEILGNSLFAQIYHFELENQIFVQKLSKYFVNKTQINFEKSSTKTGRLVKLKGYNFYLSKTDIYLLEQKIQNVIYVQGSQELYLGINFNIKKLGNDVKIILNSVENGKFKQLQVIEIKQSAIIEELEKNSLLMQFSNYLIAKYKILSSSLVNNILKIEVIQDHEQFSLISQFIYDLKQSTQQYKIKYVIRHPYNDEIQNVEFYQNYIILKSQYRCYLFEIRDNQIYYDYFSSFIDSTKLIDQFDSLSHQISNQQIISIQSIDGSKDLIFVTEENKFYYGNIGYKIEGESNNQEQFQLRAQNDISNELLLVTVIPDQVETFVIQKLLVLVMLIFIIIFIYIKRRNRLQKQNIEKVKQRVQISVYTN